MHACLQEAAASSGGGQPGGGQPGGGQPGGAQGPTAAQILDYETCVAKCDNLAACEGDAVDFSTRCDGR